MSLSLEEITRRLAEIQDSLLEMGDGPSLEKYELLTSQDALRAQATEFQQDWDAERSDEELESELDSLRRRRQQLVRSRTGYVSSKGGSNQGPASGAWVKLGQQSLAGAGLDQINARISELEDEVAMRAEGEH